MKMTRQRKILFVVLALGACALLVDRLSSASENPAQAAEHAVPQRLTTEARSMLDKATPVLAERIRQAARDLGDGGSSRYLFQVAESWVGRQPAPRVPSRVHGHQLQAVLAGQAGSALINGRLVRVGQSVDGYRLVQVTENTAVLQAGNERIVLRMQGTAPAADQPRGAEH